MQSIFAAWSNGVAIATGAHVMNESELTTDQTFFKTHTGRTGWPGSSGAGDLHYGSLAECQTFVSV